MNGVFIVDEDSLLGSRFLLLGTWTTEGSKPGTGPGAWPRVLKNPEVCNGT
jgi:hypothetical protein